MKVDGFLICTKTVKTCLDSENVERISFIEGRTYGISITDKVVAIDEEGELHILADNSNDLDFISKNFRVLMSLV